MCDTQTSAVWHCGTRFHTRSAMLQHFLFPNPHRRVAHSKGRVSATTLGRPGLNSPGLLIFLALLAGYTRERPRSGQRGRFGKKGEKGILLLLSSSMFPVVFPSKRGRNRAYVGVNGSISYHSVISAPCLVILWRCRHTQKHHTDHITKVISRKQGVTSELPEL